MGLPISECCVEGLLALQHAVHRLRRGMLLQELPPLLAQQLQIVGKIEFHRILGAGQNCTRWVMPPSQIRLVPEMKLARGLARNTTALATSSGVAMRPMGLRSSAWR